MTKVNRELTPREALKATGRKEYIWSEEALKFPKFETTNIEIEIFTVGKTLTNAKLDAEYKKRGLLQDPLAFIAYMAENPTAADEKFIACKYNEKDYVTCVRWLDERGVRVGQDDGGWDDDWWFAGVRKSGSLEAKTLGTSFDSWTLGHLENWKKLKI